MWSDSKSRANMTQDGKLISSEGEGAIGCHKSTSAESSALSDQTGPDEATCSLGQALFALKGTWHFISEAGFLATRKSKDLPKEPEYREALIIGLATGTLRHSGVLALWISTMTPTAPDKWVAARSELGELALNYTVRPKIGT